MKRILTHFELRNILNGNFKENTEFKNYYKLDSKENIVEIKIFDAIINDNISTVNFKILKVPIFFQSIEFNGVIQFINSLKFIRYNYLRYSINYNFLDCKFKSKIKFQGFYNDLSIMECSLKDIYIDNGFVAKQFVFWHNNLNNFESKSKYIVDSSFVRNKIENFSIFEGTYKKISFKSNNIVNLNINYILPNLKINSKNVLGEVLYIYQLEIDNQDNKFNLEIDNIIIYELVFKGTYNKLSRVNIIKSEIHKLTFEKLVNNGIITIDAICPIHKLISDDFNSNFKFENNANTNYSNDWYFNTFTQYDFFDFLVYYRNEIKRIKDGKYIKYKAFKLIVLFINFGSHFIIEYFSKSKSFIRSVIKFEEVIFGNRFYIRNTDVRDYENVIIYKSDISELNIFNSTFSTKNIEGSHNTKYELFNNLYSISKSKNNKKEQVEYYSAAQRSLLKSYNNRLWYLKIPSITSLSISWFFSSYGTNWIKSTFFAIPFFSILFFSLMLLLTNYDISISSKGIENISKFGVYYIQYLNPTHILSFMDENIIDGLNYSNKLYFVLFDFIGRIFIGIGIYESINAFRKYVRK